MFHSIYLFLNSFFRWLSYLFSYLDFFPELRSVDDVENVEEIDDHVRADKEDVDERVFTFSWQQRL